MVLGLSCSTAYGIFPDQGLNPCLSHWKVDSLLLSHQGNHSMYLKLKYNWFTLLCEEWKEIRSSEYWVTRVHRHSLLLSLLLYLKCFLLKFLKSETWCFSLYVLLKLLLLLFSHEVVSDSLRPHGRWPARLSVHGILQARILEWVAISFSRGSFRPRDQTHDYCLAGRLFTTEPLKRMLLLLSCVWLFATPGTAALQAPDHTVKFQTV